MLIPHEHQHREAFRDSTAEDTPGEGGEPDYSVLYLITLCFCTLSS